VKQRVSKIGVFDSGLGGLSVLRTLQRELPTCSFVYLGDTARTPYGSKRPSTVVRYSQECASFLGKHDIDLLVVACNTASSVALDEISQAVACPVIGTIKPAVRTCLAMRVSHSELAERPIGIIGTRATIQSASYQEEIRRAAPSAALIASACPLFVPLVEEGMTSGPIVEQAIEHYLAPFRNEGVSSLILACTHYPLLMGPIREFMGPRVEIVECADAIAREIKETYEQPENGTGESHFFVTDEVSRFNSLASFFLKGAAVEAVKVEAL